jgi:chaperonin GroEL
LHSTRAAVLEGIVPGGGVALLRCQHALANLKGVGGERVFGVNIVRRALEEPLRQILLNAGHEPAPIVERLRNEKGSQGFNALTDQYEDLLKAGIVDPTRVTKAALSNAASVAGLLLTTEALIADKPEKKEKGSGASGYAGE